MYKYKSLQAGQVPQERFSFLQNLLNFIIAKYLSQEVNDNWSICMDERSPCGVSIAEDVDIYHSHMIKR